MLHHNLSHLPTIGGNVGADIAGLPFLPPLLPASREHHSTSNFDHALVTPIRRKAIAMLHLRNALVAAGQRRAPKGDPTRVVAAPDPNSARSPRESAKPDYRLVPYWQLRGAGVASGESDHLGCQHVVQFLPNLAWNCDVDAGHSCCICDSVGYGASLLTVFLPSLKSVIPAFLASSRRTQGQRPGRRSAPKMPFR